MTLGEGMLREGDTITEPADTPARRLHLYVRTMYLKNDIQLTGLLSRFTSRAARCRSGCPSHDRRRQQSCSAGALYKALKETRKLVKRNENFSRPDRFDIARSSMGPSSGSPIAPRSAFYIVGVTGSS